jgi:hypothetical protein
LRISGFEDLLYGLTGLWSCCFARSRPLRVLLNGLRRQSCCRDGVRFRETGQVPRRHPGRTANSPAARPTTQRRCRPRRFQSRPAARSCRMIDTERRPALVPAHGPRALTGRGHDALGKDDGTEISQLTLTLSSRLTVGSTPFRRKLVAVVGVNLDRRQILKSSNPQIPGPATPSSSPAREPRTASIKATWPG